MNPLNDLRAGYRIIRGMVRSRSARRALAEALSAWPEPAPHSFTIGVYFADPKVNLYQLRQWYAPLVELSKTHPVVVISRAPSSMLRLMGESPLPVVYLRKIVDYEAFLEQQDIKVMLYVNQNVKNFQAMRYGRMWHTFINHGESDKAYMASNQYKAYDYAMVAGEAAVDRLRHALWDYDVEKRALVIGRPQADHFAGEAPYPDDGRIVVLYAPTWEGDRGTMGYGSVASHGEALAGRLLGDPRFRLVYRPHPRSGIQSKEYGAANQRIIEAIAAANAADPAAHHLYDQGPQVGWQLAAADVAITDISAMVYDRLATGKPLIVTRPVSESATVETTGYLGAAEWLDASDPDAFIARIEQVRADEAALDRLHFWVERHFGDTSPGAATARFHAAIETLIARWDEHAALHRHDRPVGGFDAFDGEADGEDEAPDSDA